MSAYQITVSRLRRYPVKGLEGHDLDRVEIAAGGGMPFDRRLALLLPPLPDIETTDRGTLPYFYLSRNPGLARYRLAWDGGSSFRLTAPDGDSAVFDAARPEANGAVDEALKRWFGDRPTGPPVLAPERRDGGYWDFSDTALSIINLETVRDISRTAGQFIDPLRFRANLYIDGLPAWREFALVGRTIVAGSTRLEVLRGIARCNATSIDPATNAIDINMPVHLRRTYGHIFCGVYARVAEGGELRPGDRFEPASAYAPDPYFRRAATSRPPHEWPRFLKVEDHGANLALVTTLDTWPLIAPGLNAVINLHGLQAGAPAARMPLLPESTAARYLVDPAGLEFAIGSEILVTGPFPERNLAGMTAL